MRSPLLAAASAALACGLLIGGEATAFAWFIDLILVEYIGLPDSAVPALAWSGVAVGVAAFAWVAMKVYRAELRLAAEALLPTPPAGPAAGG